MNRRGVDGSTRDKTTTRPGGPAARRLGPLPRAWRGWTPRLAALTRLHGLRPPAPAWRRARGAPRKRGYPAGGLRSVRVFDPASTSGFASALDAPTFLAQRASEPLLRRGPSGVAALRSAPGLRPPDR